MECSREIHKTLGVKLSTRANSSAEDSKSMFDFSRPEEDRVEFSSCLIDGQGLFPVGFQYLWKFSKS